MNEKKVRMYTVTAQEGFELAGDYVENDTQLTYASLDATLRVAKDQLEKSIPVVITPCYAVWMDETFNGFEPIEASSKEPQTNTQP